MLSWDLQVQQALKVCSLSVSEALLGEEMILPASSHAAQLGHTTLHSLVTKPEVEDGLSLDWEDFKAKMHAAVYLSKYSIEDSDFVEINKMVKDVSQIIGRLPATAAEFHNAKQSVLQGIINNLHREHKLRMDDVQDRNKDLMRELNTEKATVVELRTNNKKLMEDSQSRIQQMNREMAVKQDAYERDAKATIAVEVEKAEAAFKQSLGEAQAEMQVQIKEAMEERRDAEMALADLSRRIESGELVEATRLLELNLKIENAQNIESTLRDQMMKLNDELTQANKRVELSQEESKNRQETIDSMQMQVAMLEQRLREQLEDKLGSSEFAVLNERLEMRKQEIEALNARIQRLTQERDAGIKQRDQYKDNFTQLRGRFAEMKSQGSEYVRVINGELSAANMKYAKLLSTNTQLKFVMVGIATVAGVACLAVGMLIRHM
jgi:predicted  nucleic acid-binding Zn-ribbon protein